MAATDSGTLILVTGPSGAGKDTLLDSLRSQLADHPGVVFARRVITRPGDAGGEAHIAVSEQQFQEKKAAGEFWIDWSAHGLHYALPIELQIKLEQGISVLANVSRTMTTPLASLWPQTVVLEVSASQQQILQRLNQRAREQDGDIEQRLQRSVAPTAQHIKTINITNDDTIEQGIARFQQAVMSILDQSEADDSDKTTTLTSTLTSTLGKESG